MILLDRRGHPSSKALEGGENAKTNAKTPIRLPMIDMPDRSHVHVWLCSFEFLFRHPISFTRSFCQKPSDMAQASTCFESLATHFEPEV